MTSHFLRTLPLALKANLTSSSAIDSTNALRLFADSNINCLYIIGIDVRTSDLELPIELHYHHPERSFVARSKAYRYTFCDDEHSAIYSLPALLSVSTFPSQYKSLGNQDENKIMDFEVHVPCKDGSTENLGVASFCIATQQTSTTVLESWLAFFDFLIYSNKIIDFDNEMIVRFKNLNELIEQFCEDDNRAPRSIILKIAEQSSDILPILSRKLRKNLQNTRTLLPVDRINALDGKCLEYLMKIEGNSIRDKAQKNKLKLMGLTKIESYNLLENRVLKDFLHRCNQKASSYLVDFEEFTKSDRGSNDHDVQKIRIFKSRCSDLSNNTELENVPRQTSLPKPNFVLQKDPYYKKIWALYLDIIHEKQDIEQTIACQQNLFHDICDLIINSALCHLCELPDVTLQHDYRIRTITKSYVKLNSNIMAGHRIKLGCNAGPFLVYRSAQSSCVIEVITNGSDNLSIPQKFVKQLSAMRLLATAPSYLLFSLTSAGSKQQHLLVPIFTVHANASSMEDIKSFNSMLQKLSILLDPVKHQIHPCFMLSTSLNLDDNDNFLVQCNRHSTVLVQHHPRNWLKSRDAFERLISYLVEMFLDNN